MRYAAFLHFLLAALSLPACVALLPKQDVRTEVPWATFDAARSMVQAIRPYQTSKSDLAAVGVSEHNPAVTLLSHVDIAVRFPIALPFIFSAMKIANVPL
jgi:hypothetical protein